MRDVEMIARRLGREAGGAVRRDAVAEAAVDALELAALAGLLRQLLVAPDAVDQYAHGSTSFPCRHCPPFHARHCPRKRAIQLLTLERWIAAFAGDPAVCVVASHSP